MRFSHVILLVFSFWFVIPAQAQIRKHKRKRSTNAGTLYFDWGYNRTAYTKSTIHFLSADPAYDFTLKGVQARDKQPKPDIKYYVNPQYMTIPQYNFRIGYYFKHKWAISLGVDHFNYIVKPDSEAELNGHLDLDADSTWQGNYDQKSVTLNSNHFRYEHSGGLNYIRIEVMRSFDLVEAGRQREFAITGSLGASLGPTLTTTNFYFGGEFNSRATALSGYGMGLSGNVRLEFFRHVFIQTEGMLGFTHLPGVRTSSIDRNMRAKQAFGFATYNVAFGLIFYLNPKNACDSCPKW